MDGQIKRAFLLITSLTVLAAGMIVGSCSNGGGGGEEEDVVVPYHLSLEAHRFDPGNTEVKVITLNATLTKDGNAVTGASVNWSTTSGVLSGETETVEGIYTAVLSLPTPTGGEATVTASYGGASGSITVIGADYLDLAWDVPISLSLNTDGWEDTPFISPDGQTLYFSYAGFDINRLLIDLNACLAAHGGTCPDQSLTFKGVTAARPGSHGWYNFDVFEAARIGENSWSVTDSSVNNYVYDDTYYGGIFAPAFDAALMTNYPAGAVAYSHEASPSVSPDGLNMLTMMMTKSGALLFYSQRASTSEPWPQSQPLPDAVNSGGDSDNPRIVFVDSSTQDFYFNSGAIGCGAPPCKQDLLVSAITGTVWSSATATIFSNINQAGSNEIQPFVTADNLTLYFASDRGGISMEIWQSTRANRASNFAAPTKVLSMWHYAGAGGPALREDGSEMFFVYVKLNAAGDGFDAQLGYVKKRP